MPMETQQCVCDRLWCIYLQAVVEQATRENGRTLVSGELTVMGLTCPEGWICPLVVPSTSEALVEVPLPGAGSSEDTLRDLCNIIWLEGEGPVSILVTMATRG